MTSQSLYKLRWSELAPVLKSALSETRSKVSLASFVKICNNLLELYTCCSWTTKKAWIIPDPEGDRRLGLDSETEFLRPGTESLDLRPGTLHEAFLQETALQ